MSRASDSNRLRSVAGLCIDIAKGLIVAGAATARVEETVQHVGHSCGVPIESQVTPTSVVVSVGDDRPVTRNCRVKSRTIDLNKLVELNMVSRAMSSYELPLHAAKLRIAKILSRPPLYSSLTMYLGQAFCCAGFAIILGGGPLEVPPAFVVGLLCNFMMVRTAKLPMFLGAFLCALTTTVAAIIFHAIIPLVKQEPTIIAGIVPLLPGLSLANAVADLMAGELTAGVARTTESILCAAALAAGVAVGLNVGVIL